MRTMKDVVAELVTLGVETTVQTVSAAGLILDSKKQTTLAHYDPSTEQLKAIAEALSTDIQGLIVLFRPVIEDLFAGGGFADLGALVAHVLEHAQEFEDVLVGVVTLIDTLIMRERRRSGGSQDLEQLSRDAKQVVRYLIVNSSVDLSIGRFPHTLVQVLLDIVLDQVIDVLIDVLNDMPRLGYVTPPARGWLGKLLDRLRASLTELFWWGLDAFSFMLNRVWFALRRVRPPSPQLQQIIAAFDIKGHSVFQDLLDILDWLIRNRGQIRAVVEATFKLVNDVERYGQLSGPQKKRVVVYMVVHMLQQYRLIPPRGPLVSVAEVLVGALTEAAVSIYNQRNIFQH